MQHTVKLFTEQHDLACPAMARYIDLVSEAGELGKELLKATDYGKTELQPNDRIKLEAGDCLFSLLALMNELGIDAQHALNGVLQKYEQRIHQQGDAGSGR